MKELLLIGKNDKTSKYISFFMKQGFICFQTPSELEAFTFINKKLVDLVLVIDTSADFHSGDICEKIRMQSPVPIVRILDSEDTSDLVKALRSGANVCLTHLVDEDELMARVEAVLRRSEFNSKI